MYFAIKSSLFNFILATVMSELLFASGNVFHIVATLDNPCPGEFDGVPCLTLQQYVSNPSIEENVTLLFETGYHLLSSSFSVTQSMAYILSGSNVEIFCSSAAKISFSTVSDVHISGITFTQCSLGISFTAITTLTLESCVFQDMRSGFAFGLDETNPPVRLVNIASGYIKSSLFFNNTNTVSHGLGGVLYVSGVFLQINDSTFTGNAARRNGGAIYARADRGNEYDTVLLIHNSTFSHNIVQRSFITDGGGAMFVINGYPRMFKCSLMVSMSTFKNNKAQTYGGGIYYQSPDKAVIQHSYFVNNTVATYSGGAIYSTSMVNMIGSNFIENAAIEGGAIYVSNASAISECTFFNNTADTYGGALYSDGVNSSILVSRSSFIHNTAKSHGGAAIYSNSHYSNISLESSIFNFNSASFCSVLDLDEFYHFNVSITDSSFEQNEASSQHNAIGGGVACIRNASLSILRSNFSNNRGYHHGGVFYIDESNVLVSGSLFFNNYATLDGGVFYTNVHASNYDIRNSQFTDNTAGDDGGVLYVGRKGSAVRVVSSLFTFNKASDQGGVIAAVASSNLQVSSSNVFNNSASYGDVISACSVDIITVNEDLVNYTNQLQPSCSFYNGIITYFNITTETDTLSHPDEVVPHPSSAFIKPAMSSTAFKQVLISDSLSHSLLISHESSTTSLISMVSYNPIVELEGPTKSTNEMVSNSTNPEETTRSSFIQETELKFNILIAVISTLLIVNILIMIYVGVTFVRKQKCRRKSTDSDSFYNSQNPAYGTHTIGTIERELVKMQ